MNMQRNILIAALLVITYLMVLQWNNDYGQGEPLPASETEMSMANEDLPTLPAADGANDDVPQAIESGAGDVPATPVQTATTATGLIRVQTDTLNLSITPLGGDIVALPLPQEPCRKDRPDLRYQLLAQSNNRTYIDQSGLAGRSGHDARANGRPLYSAEQTSYQLAEGDDSLTVDLRFSEDGVNYI